MIKGVGRKISEGEATKKNTEK